MSPVETRKVIHGVPVEDWSVSSPNEVLYRSSKKHPFRYTRGDWNVGRTHLNSVRVGEDGKTIACDVTTLLVPADFIEGPKHGISTRRAVTFDRESIPQGTTIPTGKPFLKREIRIT